jgi:hypothetical protein
MNRREFLLTAAAGPRVRHLPPSVDVPVRHVIDRRAKFDAEQVQHFWSQIWPEAVRDFERCGVKLRCEQKSGEVRRSPSDQPILVGLERGAVNIVLTDRIPLEWDRARGLTGVTTLYRGYHLSMVAIERAHAHELPLLAVNTCVHELLHVLLHDIFESRPTGLYGAAREFRVDLYATRLWLLHDGGAIRQAAESYVTRLTASG